MVSCPDVDLELPACGKPIAVRDGNKHRGNTRVAAIDKVTLLIGIHFMEFSFINGTALNLPRPELVGDKLLERANERAVVARNNSTNASTNISTNISTNASTNASTNTDKDINSASTMLGHALCDNALESSSGAVFDRRRRYRYLLWRSWDPVLPAVSFVMLNPSAADEHSNDPTISRSISIAQELGFGRIFVVNLFGYMTKSPALLRLATDPVTSKSEAKQGRHNDDFIRFALSHSNKTVLAWGNHGSFLNRGSDVLELVRSQVNQKNCYVFAITKQGQPRHPLYTPRSISLQSAPRDLWT